MIDPVKIDAQQLATANAALSKIDAQQLERVNAALVEIGAAFEKLVTAMWETYQPLIAYLSEVAAEIEREEADANT